MLGADFTEEALILLSLPDSLENIISHAFLNRARLTFDVGKVPKSKRFYVLQKDGEAKWILPWNHKIGLAALSGWEPYSKLSQLKWGLMLALYRMGLLGMLGNVKKIGIEIPDSFPWDLLGWLGNGRPVPVIYVGNPATAQQKLVMFLTDEGQQGKIAPEMVIKVPLGTKAKASILNEAEQIESILFLQGSQTPDILFLDSNSGISAQSYSQAAPEGRDLTERHLAWLYALPDLPGVVDFQITCESLASRIERLEISEEKRVIVHDILGLLVDRAKLKAVVLHGDFAPWNIKKRFDGSLVVLDWEAAKSPSLPLLDLIHHELMDAYTSNQPLTILPAFLRNQLVRQYMAHYGITDDLARQLFLFYVLDRWCRNLENGEVEIAEQFWQDVCPVFKEAVS